MTTWKHILTNGALLIAKATNKQADAIATAVVPRMRKQLKNLEA